MLIATYPSIKHHPSVIGDAQQNYKQKKQKGMVGKPHLPYSENENEDVSVSESESENKDHGEIQEPSLRISIRENVRTLEGYEY